MISNNPITNVTISNITIGIHNITVYANDSYGNVGSQTVNFTVEKQQTEIFVNTIIIAVITVPVAIICLVAILLVFRRHRKTSNSNQRPFPTVGFIDPI
jgi:ABC-type Fe3+ transport system permease subunit